MQLTLATEAQFREAKRNQKEEWGHGFTWEEYFERELTRHRVPAHGRTMQCWVLSDDTLEAGDFFCSVEAYKHDAWAGSKGSALDHGYSYAISSVVTPRKHRGKGHASVMMDLLRKELIKEKAFMSTLYSDVGLFYERFGWRAAPDTFETKWTLSPVPGKTPPALPEGVSLITAENIEEVANRDIALLKESLAESQEPAFFLEPNASVYDFYRLRNSFYTKTVGHQEPLSYYGYLVSTEDLGFFIVDTDSRDKMAFVLRVRWPKEPANQRKLAEAFSHFVTVAGSEFGCLTILGWDVPSGFANQTELKSETYPRTEHISAVNWLGDESKAQTKWLLNEWYAWC